jgi:hypothetical protein
MAGTVMAALNSMKWLIGVFVLVVCSSATINVDAHDPNRPDLDRWYDGLQAKGKWVCCHKRDAKELDDSDWDMKESHYRVRLNGRWYEVSDNALVIDKNLVGRALVWITFSGGTPVVRCFLPGTMT